MNLPPYRYPKIYLTVFILLIFLCSAPGLAWVSEQECPALVNITGPGHYSLDPSIISDSRTSYAIKSSGVTLDGNGQTFTRPFHGTCPAIVLESPSLSAIHLTNLNLYGDFYSNNYDIDLSGVSNGSISDIRISNSTFPQVIIGGSTIEISDNVLDRTGDGIVVSGSHINIHDNTLNDTGLVTGGIDVSGSDIDIHNNALTKNSMGITVSGSKINISDNVLNNHNTRGIEISGTDITISNNVLEQNSEGIVVDGSNVIIKKNSVRNHNVLGFIIRGTNFTISHNVFKQNVYGISSGSENGGVSDVILSNNIFEQNDYGFTCLLKCSNLTFLENSAKNNGGVFFIVKSSGVAFSNNTIERGNNSIGLESSNNITIINNTFLKPRLYAISISESGLGGELISTKITIRDNTIRDCGAYGIYLQNTSLSSISNNTIMNSSYGIGFLYSQNGAAFNNSLSGNKGNTFGNGINLYNSSKINIYNNYLSFNEYGIWLVKSRNNVISNNRIVENTLAGIACYLNSSNNTVYNNFFNNTNNTLFFSSKNQSIWNTTKKAGKNIINGTFLGGNYWATPRGNGYSQTCSDANNDGICDTSYTLNSQNTDYLPLTFRNSPPQPTIIVVVPNGGENWKQGSPQMIRWNYTGNPGPNVKIELLKGIAVNRIINASTSIGTGGSGNYTWIIPYNQVLGTDYKIRINSTSNAALTNMSKANFTISAGVPITVVKPNGGENWKQGSTQTVKWSYSGSPGSKVKIELLKGTALNRVINASTSIGSAGSGSYSWKIPYNQVVGTDYKIRVTSTSNAAYTDKSNANFTISAGAPITVVVPNGGANWKRGSTHTITWSYTGSPGSKVKIELLKGTAVNRTINASTSIGSAGSGSYIWNIPSTQTLGTDYKIRINSTSNAAYTDKSNANFTISAS
jgi:parallel beta-helix repeat protein